MCGIFGVISNNNGIEKTKFRRLVKHSQQRGVDSSGLVFYEANHYKISRADFNIDKLLGKVCPYFSSVVLGHSRLITNGLGDNQPVVRGNICAIHNGIIVNEEEIWSKLSVKRQLQIDSEVIVAIAEEFLANNGKIEELPREILLKCKGVVACALVLPAYGKLLLFSNNGSLYIGNCNGQTYFASESYGLGLIGCSQIRQLKEDLEILDIPKSLDDLKVEDFKNRTENLIPEFKFNQSEEKLLIYPNHQLRRCTKCILPETMPFIKFDEKGVCNYCKNYKPRNNPKPKEELFKLVEQYRRQGNELD